MVGRVGRLERSGTGACPGRDGLESDGDRHRRPDDQPGPASTSLNLGISSWGAGGWG